MNNIKINILWISLLMLVSCQTKDEITDKASFYKYLDDPENGLVVIKEANNIQLKVKYLPAAYLALKDYDNSAATLDMDSLLGSYAHQQTFMLSISPVDENNTDIMFEGVGAYTEFKQRLYSLNFEIEDYVLLKTESKEYKPVLSSFERLYGLKAGRDILFVFTPETKTDQTMFESGTLIFEFEDMNFETGITRFKFETDALEALASYDLQQLITPSK